MKEYKNKIILLLSSFEISDKQTTDQEQAMELVESKQFPYEIVDGFDPSVAKRREELFRISGIRGNYPQIFVHNSEASTTTYLGDYQRLEDINEDSRLPETIIGAHPLIMTWDRILAAGYRHKLLLMISTWNADKKQRSDQERTIAVLKAKKIPFEVLDAADPNVKDRRNELFEISGIRGQFPQIFLVEGETSADGQSQHSYVGGWETIEDINDMSAASDVEAFPEAITWERLLNTGIAVE